MPLRGMDLIFCGIPLEIRETPAGLAPGRGVLFQQAGWMYDHERRNAVSIPAGIGPRKPPGGIFFRKFRIKYQAARLNSSLFTLI